MQFGPISIIFQLNIVQKIKICMLNIRVVPDTDLAGYPAAGYPTAGYPANNFAGPDTGYPAK